ncbi:MAG: hypothetical protein JWR16_3323 [Nevskia sp.]|nr:hypothetical protein [Nevskia sp.]
MRVWSALCGALLLCGAPAARAADPEPVLTVAAVAGRAEVERLGERHRLQVGDVLDERDVLHLDDDGHLALRLARGGVLELGPHAELSVEKLPGTARNDHKSIFNLAHGYLRIAWAPPANVTTPFYLYFSGQRASLTEGEYFFDGEPDAARVCVASGKLTAIPIAGSNPHLLIPAACYRLSNGAEPESIARDAAAWAGMRRNFSLNAPTSPEAELAANDPSVRGATAAITATPAAATEHPRATAAVAPTVADAARLARTEPVRPVPAAPVVAAAPAVTLASGSWAINIASYSDQAPADKQAKELQAGGYNATVQPAQVNGRQWYRVQVRGFDSSAAAQAQMQALKTKSGYANVWVVRAP